MLRHLFASTIILGSVVVLSEIGVYGQSIDLPFSGTINRNCTFSESIDPGELRLITSDTIGSRGPGLSFTGAGFSVNCSGPTNVTITAPIQTAGPTLSPINCSSALTPLNNNINTDPILTFDSCNGSSPTVNIGSESFAGFVDISVRNNSSIPSRTYAYRVTLSITP